MPAANDVIAGTGVRVHAGGSTSHTAFEVWMIVGRVEELLDGFSNHPRQIRTDLEFRMS